MNVEKVLKRITLVISLLGLAAMVLLACWSLFLGSGSGETIFFVVLGGIWFLVVWGIYLLVRWVIWGFTSGSGSSRE